jgi:hypothetical protein
LLKPEAFKNYHCRSGLPYISFLITGTAPGKWSKSIALLDTGCSGGTGSRAYTCQLATLCFSKATCSWQIRGIRTCRCSLQPAFFNDTLAKAWWVASLCLSVSFARSLSLPPLSVTIDGPELICVFI